MSGYRARIARYIRRVLRARCRALMTAFAPPARCVLREGHDGLHSTGRDA